MDAGGLNRRVQIQQQATTQGPTGQPLQTWNIIYTAWAAISVQKSQLLYETAQFVSKVTHRITMRWTSSLVFQPPMRAVYTEATTGVVHTYNIEAILNTDQRNRELVILAYELGANE
jgi:SPP1 family predicted phage head-tail adaptor